MPGLKPVAFLDLDGPILDVSARHYRVYTTITSELGGTPVDAATFWSAKRRKIPEEEILRRSGLARFETTYQTRKREYIESPALLACDRLQPGTPEILTLLAGRYRLVLITLRHSRAALEAQLADLQLADRFSAVLSSPAGERPGWETKRDLATHAGFGSVSGGFFAGDTETDLRAGRALSVATVAVCNGIREPHFLELLKPDWIIQTLADLESTPLLR